VTVKIYFETMTSGMAAKLDPKYRIRNSYANNTGKLPGNSLGSRNLLEKFGYIPVSRKR